MANTVNLKDKSKNIIYPSTDWSVINNKPTDLATTEDLGVLGAWTTSGITFENGGYAWGAQSGSTSQNCAYRVCDFGTFRLVELRCVFGVTTAVTDQTTLITLPSTILPDGDIQSWYGTDDGGSTNIWLGPPSVGLRCLPGKAAVVGHMYSLHTMWFTTA
ncbi:hypothetical protein [Liquorilactobacillus mali]|uniref:hypothetical protein n=1 Tax=Liquorilactobacillus mali TaxID=1618 RepID=UPI00295481D3|nr:hypothetical protein [Liquorilactobacillus mali]MDV7758266.1 hypothetical protein [Liquorilactobacillus mali]